MYMSVLRILGRPRLATFSDVLAGWRHTTGRALGPESNSEIRQRELLQNYYLMCDVDERHHTMRSFNKAKHQRWLREHHRKQDVENRMLEAGLLKYNTK